MLSVSFHRSYGLLVAVHHCQSAPMRLGGDRSPTRTTCGSTETRERRRCQTNEIYSSRYIRRTRWIISPLEIVIRQLITAHPHDHVIASSVV